MTNDEREALIAQGWAPPVAVDPDLAEAEKIRGALGLTKIASPILRAGIKRGRELERAEAKPGLVWVKHDGTGECPIDPNQRVCVLLPSGDVMAGKAAGAAWKTITHYAIITPPTEDAA